MFFTSLRYAAVKSKQGFPRDMYQGDVWFIEIRCALSCKYAAWIIWPSQSRALIQVCDLPITHRVLYTENMELVLPLQIAVETTLSILHKGPLAVTMQ